MPIERELRMPAYLVFKKKMARVLKMGPVADSSVSMDNTLD